MSEATPELSVCIPFYDEEENVLPLLEELVPVLEGLSRSWEIVAVNDGSGDATGERLREAAARWPALRHLALAVNTGQTAAFHAAFAAARGELIITMDGDLQIDPADIPKMLVFREEQGVDFVNGWRKDRKDKFLKRVSTKVANGVRNWLTKERIKDTGCPLKIFRAEILKAVPPFTGMHRFFVTLGHMAGYTSAEMVVNHRQRRAGKSKYGIWNRVFRALRDCFVVRWMQRRYFRYDVTEESGRS